jgi:hypothetical protein
VDGGPARGGYWPSRAQELMLRAALLPPREALAAWEALRPAFDPDRLEPGGRRLLPLLGAALARLGIDDPVVARLGAERRAVLERNHVLFAAARPLIETLRGAGIDTLVLKGGALARTRYADPGLRPMADVDVLVPTARAQEAIGVLAGAGWAPRVPITAGFVRMQHAANLRSRTAEGAKCDLHWHAYWECCHEGADDDLWAASVPLDWDGAATRMLAPADQLVHVCVNGSRRAGRPSITWVADALLILRAGDVDWPRVLAQARARRFVLRVRLMLRYLRRAFDAPVPREALDGLGAAPVSRLERLEHWAGNRRPGLLGELPAYWCNYRRFRERSAIGSPLGFVRYLQQVWRVASLGDVARGAASRAGRRIRGAGGRASAGPGSALGRQ